MQFQKELTDLARGSNYSWNVRKKKYLKRTERGFFFSWSYNVHRLPQSYKKIKDSGENLPSFLFILQHFKVTRNKIHMMESFLHLSRREKQQQTKWETLNVARSIANSKWATTIKTTMRIRRFGRNNNSILSSLPACSFNFINLHWR